MDNNLIRLLVFCFCLALVLSGTIFIINQCRLLNGISKLTVIRKRYSQITNIVVGLSIFIILIIFTFKSGIILFEEKMNGDTNNILLICKALGIKTSLESTFCSY